MEWCRFTFVVDIKVTYFCRESLLTVNVVIFSNNGIKTDLKRQNEIFNILHSAENTILSLHLSYRFLRFGS